MKASDVWVWMLRQVPFDENERRRWGVAAVGFCPGDTERPTGWDILFRILWDKQNEAQDEIQSLCFPLSDGGFSFNMNDIRKSINQTWDYWCLKKDSAIVAAYYSEIL